VLPWSSTCIGPVIHVIASGTLREDLRKAPVVCRAQVSARPRTVALYPFLILFNVKAGGRYSNHSALHVPPGRQRVAYVVIDVVAPTLHCVHFAAINAVGAPANDNLITDILEIMQP